MGGWPWVEGGTRNHEKSRTGAGMKSKVAQVIDWSDLEKTEGETLLKEREKKRSV